MPNDTNQNTVSTLIRWTEDEWRTIARELRAKQGVEPIRALDLQKMKARDVFVAQEALPEDRHRKLASIAQGFAGIRARLNTLTQIVPGGGQVTACAEKTEVHPERRTASDTAASVLRALEHGVEASELKLEVVYGLMPEGGRKAVEVFVGEFDCLGQINQQRKLPPCARISKT